MSNKSPDKKKVFRYTRDPNYRHPLIPDPYVETDPEFMYDHAAANPPKKKGRKSTKDNNAENDAKRAGPSTKANNIPADSKKKSRMLPKQSATLASGVRTRPAPPPAHSPFVQYFAGLGLKLDFDDDDDSAIVEEVEEPEEEEEEEVSEVDDDDDDYGQHYQHPSGLTRSLAAFLDSKSRSNTASTSGSRAGTSTPQVQNEGDKGYDSDDDAAQLINGPLKPPRLPFKRLPKRKLADTELPPAKKVKAPTPPPVEDDSATEPESVKESDSETEPESPESESETEPESDYDEGNEPRPNIPRKEDQPLLKPFILDVSKGGRGIKTQVPGCINTYLRDYQRDGIKFFWERYKEGRGGLLGDDMGLVRKTIQVISFLSAIMRKTGDNRDLERRHTYVSKLQDGEEWRNHRKLPPANAKWPTCLIIAPASVVPNWAREFEKWGYFELGVYVSGKDRGQVLKDFKYGRLDVVLTTFDLARQDIDLLDDLAWSCIIVDEVHCVKNATSKITEALNKFHCMCRFGLTGTAIQNSYGELWTILNFTNPGCVGTKKQWRSLVTEPLTRGHNKTASEDERWKAAEVAMILKKQILPNYFIRRTKDLIKDQLPKKIDEVVFCPLTSEQVYIYKRILKTEAVQNLMLKDDPCECGSKDTRKNCCHPYDQGDLFKYMSALIQVSNHVALIIPGDKDSKEQVLRLRELAKQVFPPGRMPSYGPAMLMPQYCGKWTVLQALLKEWRKDRTNKVLIFTKSRKLLDMLDFHLQSKGIGYVRLDGLVKQSDRMSLIDKFQEDPDVFVFLISTKVGGTGLNLTAANKVVIFDPNWNPAHDLQAMDRAYRYGQTRDVSVYRLLGAGSIEELIYARQVYKQQQMAVGYNASLQTRYFEGVQGDKTRQGDLFGIKNIFKLHEDTLATKMAIEKATLTDLDWALANMEAKPKKSGAKKWIYEAEAKAQTVMEDVDVKGLGALLFDDDALPKLQHNDEKHLSVTLKRVGVNYTHRNEDLIQDSAIEAQRLKKLAEEKKKKAEKSRTAKSKNEPVAEWPPRRSRYRSKVELTPAEKWQSRLQALLDLHYITSADGLTTFAHEFTLKSADEQREIIEQLDTHLSKLTSAH